MIYKTTFAKNFLIGFASILNLFPEPIKNPISKKSPDELIRESWESAGNYLKGAMKDADKEIEKRICNGNNK